MICLFHFIASSSSICGCALLRRARRYCSPSQKSLTQVESIQRRVLLVVSKRSFRRFHAPKTRSQLRAPNSHSRLRPGRPCRIRRGFHLDGLCLSPHGLTGDYVLTKRSGDDVIEAEVARPFRFLLLGIPRSATTTHLVKRNLAAGSEIGSPKPDLPGVSSRKTSCGEGIPSLVRTLSTRW